jgi:hypothetical protein
VTGALAFSPIDDSLFFAIEGAVVHMVPNQTAKWAPGQVWEPLQVVLFEEIPGK